MAASDSVTGGGRATIARHGRLRRRSGWGFALQALALTVAVALLSLVAIGGVTVLRLGTSVDTFDIGEAPVPEIGAFEGGFNVLVIGSDTREGQGDAFGDTSGTLNDVNLLLHVSANHDRAVAVSIPRDLIVPVPACPDPDGGELSAMSAQPINSVLSHGGVPCVVMTVEAITGLDIQFAGLITFTGVIEMTNAVGGVPVCIDAPIRDTGSGLDLETAGEHVLQGANALAFLRTRKGVGDRSDLARISSQQVYLSSLVRTLKSSDTLGDLSKVYLLAEAAIANMQLSTSLGNITTMVSMARALRDIPLENVAFVQFPNRYASGGNRVVPDEALADQLFAIIRADGAFRLPESSTGEGSTPVDPPPAPEPSATASAEPTEPTESPTPDPGGEVIEGLSGQTADQRTCSVSSG